MRTNLHRPQGRPSTDPRAFYGLPHGAILPFGSQYGYKGFGLALLVDLLGGCRPASSAQTFKALVEDMRAYVVNTLPMKDFGEALPPDAIDFCTRERRLREGVPLADESWQRIVGFATSVEANLKPRDK